MSTNKRKPKIKIQYHRTCFHSLQYEIVTIYKKDASITDIVNEAIKDFPELGFMTEDQYSGAGAITILPPNSSRTIYMIYGEDLTYDIVAHESIHATSFSFYLVQTQHNEQTEEIYAYNFQSILIEITRVLLDEFKIDKELFYGIKKEEGLDIEINDITDNK